MEQQKQAAPKKKNKVWNVISTILVVIIVLLALALVGARLIGLRVYTVLSGSMEPTYHVGSIIYVKKVDPYTIKEGQPITFMLNEDTIATHRVVAVVPDEEDSPGSSADLSGEEVSEPPATLMPSSLAYTETSPSVMTTVFS